MSHITWRQLVEHHPIIFSSSFHNNYAQLFLAMDCDDHKELVKEIEHYLKHYILRSVEVQAIAAYMNFIPNAGIILTLWCALNEKLENLLAVHPFVASKIVVTINSMSKTEQKLYNGKFRMLP